ncbi:MAG TPA: hypothetical protein VI110_00610, partial [Lapillicoccus sp.]
MSEGQATLQSRSLGGHRRAGRARRRVTMAALAGGALVAASVAVPTAAHAAIHTDTFGCQSGSPQTWAAPGGVTSVDVVVDGAPGGNSDNSSGGAKGLGGHTTSTLSVLPGTTYTVLVGCDGSPILGGVGFGQGGGAFQDVNGQHGGGGGGGSALLQANGTVLMAAGGGGGAGTNADGGGGGGLNGQAGENGTGGATGGAGGTQVGPGSGGSPAGSPGVLHDGGNGERNLGPSAGGGGGGWFGGGGGGIPGSGGG